MWINNANFTTKQHVAYMVSVSNMLCTNEHVNRMLPMLEMKYSVSKKRSVRCLFLTRNRGRTGCVRIVGNDHKARHKATLPAESH